MEITEMICYYKMYKLLLEHEAYTLNKKLRKIQSMETKSLRSSQGKVVSDVKTF
jgi:hypothetical protein